MILNLFELKNPQKVTDFLTPRLAGYFPEIKAPRIKNCEIHTLKESSSFPLGISVLLKLKLEDISFHQIEKWLVINGKEGGNQQKNFELFQYIYNHGFNSGQFRVPRPFECLTNEGILIYEAGHGFSLRYMIVNQNQNMTQYCALTGRWLAKFHHLEPPDFLPSQNEAFEELIMPNMARIKKENKELKINLERFTKAKNYLFEKLSRSKTNTLVHGDFQPENVLIDSHQTVFSLDFEKAFLGSAAADLASFMLQLNACLFYEELGKPVARETIIDWQTAFLENYRKNTNQNWEEISNQLIDYSRFYRLNILLFAIIGILIHVKEKDGKERRIEGIKREFKSTIKKIEKSYSPFSFVNLR